MTVRVVNTIKAARGWFELLAPMHSYQSYWVLCATERVVRWRYFILNLIRPWKLFSAPTYRTYSVWDDDGKIRLIVPVEVSGGGAMIAGTLLNLDYTDVLWSMDNLADRRNVLECCFHKMRQDGIQSVTFGQLAEESPTASVLKDLPASILATSKSVLIGLNASDHPSFFATLGKHAKQNIRTAYNRLQRDGHTYSLSLFSGDCSHVGLATVAGCRALKECHLLYCKRQAQRYLHRGLIGRVAKLHFNYTSVAATSPVSFLGVLYIDGRIAAFMEGYINAHEKSIELPRLAIEDEFNWYSPGLILLNEVIKEFYKEGTYSTVDLCRGTEKYKFDMGGVAYVTNTIKIDF